MKTNVLKYVIFFNVLIISLISCSTIRPKLHKQLLPIQYTGASEIWNRSNPDNSVKVALAINSNPALNKRIVSLWKQGHFSSHFNKNHPFSSIKSQDIRNLQKHLNYTLIIHHLVFNPHQSKKIKDLDTQIKKIIGCQPLTNIEIRFIMSSGSSVTFSKKPLTMLLLSAHELLLQKKAIPTYPKVYSSFLREKEGLPTLKSLEQINLYKKKDIEPKNITFKTGFIFCQKNRRKQLIRYE